MSDMVIGLRKKEVILFEINELQEQLQLLNGLSILLANLEPIFEKCLLNVFVISALVLVLYHPQSF